MERGIARQCTGIYVDKGIGLAIGHEDENGEKFTVRFPMRSEG